MRIVGIENGQIGVVFQEWELKLLTCDYRGQGGSAAWQEASDRYGMPFAYDAGLSLQLKSQLRQVAEHYPRARPFDNTLV